MTVTSAFLRSVKAKEPSFAESRFLAGYAAVLTDITRHRWISVALGGIAGLASGLLGVGGGFLLVPLQVIWSGVSQRRASGTSLAAILPIALVGAAIYYFGAGRPQVDVTVALFLALGSAVGAFVGAHASRKVPESSLNMLVATLLGVVGLKELHDAAFGGSAIAGSATGAFDIGHYLLISACGLVIGVLSGLTGVGGGVFVVPTLVLGFGLAQRVAQGTSLLVILPTAAIGAITHHRHGSVDVRAVGWIAAAGVPAALFGAVLALWMPVRLLAALFGLFLVFAAIRTWPSRATHSPLDSADPVPVETPS